MKTISLLSRQYLLFMEWKPSDTAYRKRRAWFLKGGFIKGNEHPARTCVSKNQKGETVTLEDGRIINGNDFLEPPKRAGLWCFQEIRE